MNGNNNKNLPVVIIVVILIALGLVWFLVTKNFINPFDNAITESEQELYEATPANGYGVGVRNDTTLGEFLVGPNGMTLYSTTMSECTGDCLEAWLPYIVSAPEESGVEAGVVGTVKRGNAYQQTYRGVPLYYFRLDEKAGDAKGHAWEAKWFVARP